MLNISDRTVCLPALGAAAVAGYILYKFATCKSHCKGRVNHIQLLDNPKVAQTFDIEDLGDKAVFCRCWKSKKFPHCDGSHNKHNEQTGDNVGPLIFTKKEKSS